MNAIDKELLPCPFCGSDALNVMHTDGTILHPHYYVECDNCGARSGGTDSGEHEEQWNTRTPSTDTICITRKDLEAMKYSSYDVCRGIFSENANTKYECGKRKGFNDCIDKLLNKQEDGE